MRSKRFEALAKRPVNQDGFVKEWIEEGFIAMESPNDPKPSIKIVNGVVTDLDGKPASQFDLIDHFIARYGINLARAEEVIAMDSVKLANMLCAPNVKRSDIVPFTTAMTPAKIVEVVSQMNVVEMMMAMQKMRARRTPSQQAHVTGGTSGRLDPVFTGRSHRTETRYVRPHLLRRNNFCLWYRTCFHRWR